MTTASHPRPAAECVLRDLLARGVEQYPDRTFLTLADGAGTTYAQITRSSAQVGCGLQSLGVQAGELVLSWLPNSPGAVEVWFGANLIGAVFAPINIANRGAALEHAVNLTQARVMVCTAELYERLAGLDLPHLRHVVLVDAEGDGVSDAGPGGAASDGERGPGHRVLGRSALRAPVPASGWPDLEVPAAPWDVLAVVQTSGTTGPSKGVLIPYAQLAETAATFTAITVDDRLLVSLPMFHVAGLVSTYRALMNGGSIALIEWFSTSTFWDTVRATGATALTLLGSMAPFLLKAPPTPRDRDHPLRKVVMIPLLEESLEFADRFGVDVWTTFNMTETSWPIFSEANPRTPRTSGRARPGVQARIVDEHDLEVGTGEIGELILRTDTPWTMAVGYLNDPVATAQAWRNGWFHTGDAFRCDADGNFFFVDRIKDSIRRRGENISSYQVESDICLHPAVHEAAVVGVSADVGESDVLAFVVLKPGHTLTPEVLLDFLVPRMPYFTVPRYVHFVDELPRTPTQKVRKTVLRERGSASAWDREAAGFTVSRRGGADRATGSPAPGG